MSLPTQKTKIVATIGPTSDSPETLHRMIRAGMNVARLNFSHGDFSIHGERIRRIREAEASAGRPVAIMADLPGPKMRLGKFFEEPVVLSSGDPFLLTAREIEGHRGGASMSFEPLPRVVKPGDRLYLNDGLVQLIVERVDGLDVHCTTAVGGELRSKKGLNLPGIDLGIGAFTPHDRDCLEFALANGVDAISQSFVQRASDIHEVRSAARALGKNPFIIAKIERSDALDHLDELVGAADGLMVARGDLGVEVPIERIALIQKQIIAKANAAGKPVITATQMLESMISSRLPTRAEATDVANAILDGTDCIMLSGESAMGRFPVESVAMLASIAASAEAHRDSLASSPVFSGTPMSAEETLSEIVQRTLQISPVTALFVPTLSGSTARKISRFKPRVWIVALSPHESTCRGLAFSYGVQPIFATEEPEDWMGYTKDWLHRHNMPVQLSVLVVGPSRKRLDTNIRIEFLHVQHPPPDLDLT